MDFVSLDLHKISSQICTLSESGELRGRRIKTTRDKRIKIDRRTPALCARAAASAPTATRIALPSAGGR